MLCDGQVDHLEFEPEDSVFDDLPRLTELFKLVNVVLPPSSWCDHIVGHGHAQRVVLELVTSLNVVVGNLRDVLVKHREKVVRWSIRGLGRRRCRCLWGLAWPNAESRQSVRGFCLLLCLGFLTLLRALFWLLVEEVEKSSFFSGH